jgi:hypothetical protein
VPDLRLLAIPALMLLTAACVGASASGGGDEPTRTAGATAAGVEPSATAVATAVPLSEQLAGLSGRLTYQSARGLVTVEFPSGAVVESPAIEPEFGGSDDGLWQERIECDEGGCTVGFFTRDGRVAKVDGRYQVMSSAWQPGAHALAFSVAALGGIETRQIIVVDDVATGEARVAYEAERIEAFAWWGDSLIVAVRGDGATHIERVDRGGIRALAQVDAPIAWFYPSPGGKTFAFTQVRDDGWHLAGIDVELESVTDYGLMGAEGAGAQPVPLSFEVKSPMAVAWSPDGSKIAFGGGWEPPYGMTIVDLHSGNVANTSFPAGYPGEMRWNAAGTQVAVSTYDPERTHHETWAVDAATGAGVHLMDGCIIVWSPDDRFLAVHGEDIVGIAIVDVVSGARMRLTEDPADAPLRWD